MSVPQDPVMLLSFLNTQLRDHYASLNALCDDLSLDADMLRLKLAQVGYAYDAACNQFR